ncbi:MAG TPA: type II and III secretion system protein family protein [Blastocatellia bacterium]|nr:type II and III secretion system protein family protein [Blastocatellia bacterium]
MRTTQTLSVTTVIPERMIVLLLSLMMLIVLAPLARAQDSFIEVSFNKQAKETTPLNLLVGQSRIIQFDRPIGRLSVSNNDIAEAVIVSADQLVVNGKAFGQINFVVWDKGGTRSLVFDVAVRANLALLDSMIRGLFPNENIQLSQTNGSVVLSGSVNDPKKAAQIESAVQAAGFKTVNLLSGPFRNVAQVQLQVRVAEVNRTRAREFGTSYGYQGSPGNGGYLNTGNAPSALERVEGGMLFESVSNTLNLFVMGSNAMTFLRALHSQGALRALAEPNLIAMDGQQASFLAGGEIPIPVVQAGSGTNTVTIMYKEYGVRLGFKPTIVSENYIRLELEPEVSTVDYVNAVKLSGFIIPAFRTRRAKTGIELQDGQSFALAGLLDNSETRAFSRMPLVGTLPVLGALFRSSQFQKQETELMFIVTAHIVKPLNPDNLPQIPGVDGLNATPPLSKAPKPTGESSGDHNPTPAPGLVPVEKSTTGAPATSLVPAEKPAVVAEPAPAAAPTAEPAAPATPAPGAPAEPIKGEIKTNWKSTRFPLMIPADVIQVAGAAGVSIPDLVDPSRRSVSLVTVIK